MLNWLLTRYWLWRYWRAATPKQEWDAYRRLQQLGFLGRSRQAR